MENSKPKLTESMAAKSGAFILVVLIAACMIFCAVAVAVSYELDCYSRSNDEVRREAMDSVAVGMADDFFTTYVDFGAEGASSFTGDVNVSFVLYDQEGKLLFGEEKNDSQYYAFTYDISGAQYRGYFNEGSALTAAEAKYTVKAFVDKSFPYSDRFSLVSRGADVAYHMRYWGYVGLVLGLIAAIVLFVFLMCATGHRKGHDGIYAGPITKIPFDLVTAAVAGMIIFIVYLAVDGGEGIGNDFAQIAFSSLGALCALPILLGWCIDFAARIKLGRWWRNTLVYLVLRLIWRILKKIVQAIAYFFKNLSLVWKTVIIMLVIILFSLIMITSWDTGSRMTLWFFGSLVLFAAMFYLAVTLRKLQEGGRKIAQGDLSYRIDTGRMRGEFKEHGENLNSIGLGMTRAVDERLKSERLKTELITNVSHDIKTPLTSIINYVDLISKEECENEKIAEYVVVLSRQSERLKKLIEDLVEASKASTGNIEVNLSPCDAGVMLAQTSGEYENKLHDCELELVITKPETPVMIMADGRLLWRVFDNLMNNICKYAQPGTRVYISLESSGGKAVISFKNVSKYALNISAEELMERFVRGDSSRHTEGSGLGLSIAKSLTELQKGEMTLDIDGDLFKALLKFSSIE